MVPKDDKPEIKQLVQVEWVNVHAIWQDTNQIAMHKKTHEKQSHKYWFAKTENLPPKFF